MLKVIGNNIETRKMTIMQKITKEIKEKCVDISGEMYIGYPIFIDQISNRNIIIDAIIICNKGVFVINILEQSVIDYADIQDEIYTKLESKLKKYKFLLNRRNLFFDMNMITYNNSGNIISAQEEYPIINNVQEFISILQDENDTIISDEQINKIISGIQEAYGIRKRILLDESNIDKKKAKMIYEMNDKIERYDENQMEAILTDPIGIQRIRGMAGSGETIVLARKAVELHTKHPDWNIIVTFQTRSLSGQIYNFIDRFYKLKNDGKAPNYDKLRIINAWGSSTNKGVYYEICIANEINPQTFNYGKMRYGNKNAFEGVCGEALKEIKEFKKIYDCIIIDEAQDFKENFYKLCLNSLTSEKRLVYAYDELQNLNDVSMKEPKELFDIDIKSDTPLKVCYRNQSKVIVTAHAIGCGIYRDEGLVQFPSSKDVWDAIGYKVENGNIIEGKKAVLYRDKETSPDFLEDDTEEIIEFINCEDNLEQEVKTLKIMREAIDEGIPYNEIMIIDMDTLAHGENKGELYAHQIAENEENSELNINIHLAGSAYREDFFRNDSIVYSSIYRAKGNEAYYVVILNAQKCVNSLTGTKDRNSLFTAITRSKGWVKVLGYGEGMKKLCNEYEIIKKNSYKLVLDKYPTKDDLKNIVINNKDIGEKDKAKIEDVRKIILDMKKSGETNIMSEIVKEIFDLNTPEQKQKFIKMIEENKNEE